MLQELCSIEEGDIHGGMVSYPLWALKNVQIPSPCSCRPVFAYPTFVYSISLTITSTYPFERKQACAHSCADLILFCSGVNSCYSGSEIIDFLCSSSMHHGPMISKLSPIIVHSSRDSPQNCDLWQVTVLPTNQRLIFSKLVVFSSPHLRNIPLAVANR